MSDAISSAPQGDRNTYLRVQSVAIFVRNLDRSLEFYTEKLGFDLVFDGRVKSGPRFVTVAPPDGSANLTLVAPEPGSEAAKLIGRPTHVTLVTDDVPAKFREWRRRGVEFLTTPRLRRLKDGVRVAAPSAADSSRGDERAATIWGGVFTRFKDPDGNSFSLVSFDEVSREIESQRRSIAERREAERRSAQELEIAREVQARLFPQALPPLRTLDYAGLCVQARAVGGDYYDFLDLGRERLGFVLGDISGKGIAAALLMANLQANLRSQCAVAWDQPERFLLSVNDLFFRNSIDTAYATLFFAVYDDANRRLRYANCGHLAALLLRSDGSLERLTATCTVVGFFEKWDCQVKERDLSPGDALVLFTDGVTEALNEKEDEFGEHRLTETLRKNRELSSQELIEAILAGVRRFSPHEQHDDITLIVAKCI
ncbi:MAG: PP2C family protein-serine/threonine phosphatase [Deltaproteobacteria bacterium]